MIKKSLFLLFLCMGGLLQAQNQHHTYFEHAPLYVNPGLAGGYEGTLRIAGMYRDQYRSIATGYRTFDLGVEYNLPFRPRKKDWISAGLAFASDKIGTFNQDISYGRKRTVSRMGAAYHFALDKKAMSDIALGVQFVSNSINAARLVGDVSNPLIRGIGDMDVMTFNNRGAGGGAGGGNESTDINTSYSDYVVGLVYTKKSKKGATQIGVSGAHILKPNQAFRGMDELPLKLTGYFRMQRMMNKRVSIEPALLYQKQGAASDISIHGIMGYDMNKDFLLRLKGGLGYRIGDSAHILLGADYKDWTIGFAYDLNISSLTPATDTFGGFEISALRQINIKKKPDIKPVIFCPRL